MSVVANECILQLLVFCQIFNTIFYLLGLVETSLHSYVLCKIIYASALMLSVQRHQQIIFLVEIKI